MILPSIKPTEGSDWKKKIKEAEELDEVCFFLTCLERKEREEFYFLARKIKRAPFVHLRSDMGADEIELLKNNFGSKIFNIHTLREHPLEKDLSEFKKSIFIENIYFPLDEKELKEFGGICLDFAHLENDRILEKEKYQRNLSVIKNFPIGCCHISCVKKKPRLDHRNFLRYDSHQMGELKELDYLRGYKDYFSGILAIELENSIEDQLKAIEYIRSF